MLDPRIYRAGFLPILFALVLVGFSLREPPTPLTTSLAPDAFDGAAAFRQLDELASAAPLRRPGSAGDALVARTVEETLRRNGFRVDLQRFGAETVDGERQLETVVGERAGFSSRRIVVLAHRDALGRSARAELSGTATLLELARVLGGRTLRRTLVLVSTSGGTGGLAGAERLAERMRDAGGVDAVLVLGDLAGTRTDRPFVVPWSRSTALAPLELRRTVESALMTEVGVRPGAVRPAVQLARLAFPLTLGEQGPFNADGLGAVLLSASGERAPAADAPVSEQRLTAFGRAALRSVGALDDGGDLPASEPYVLLQRKLLPAWPVRLLAVALMLPVLLAAVDGFARVRRRRERVGRWLGWVAVGALPFLLAALLAIGLFRVGLIEAAPDGPVAGVASAPNVAALASVVVVWLLAWLALRPPLLRLLGPGGDADPAAGGAATAVVLLLGAATLVVWIGNPYASLLLIPALHLWLLAMAPETHLRRPAAIALWALGLLPPLLVAYAYARQFALDPLELVWLGELLVAGGGISLLAVLLWSVVLGCAAAALVVVLRAGGGGSAAAAPITVRGPKTYAGPGSLGGTESALRR